jgi:hypothetical protein
VLDRHAVARGISNANLMSATDAGDVVLVLNTCEPATWRVSSSPGTRIVGVLLIGYYTSTWKASRRERRW